MRAALEMALEALERAERDGGWSIDTTKAITTIKAALAAPVQEPVGYSDSNGRAWAIKWSGALPPNLTLFATLPAAPVQEPVKPLPGADWTITMRRMRDFGCSKKKCTCKAGDEANCIWWDEPGDRPEPASAPAEPVQEPVALTDAIRSEPTEMLHKWRVLELVKEYTTPPAAQPTGKAPCERHCEANAFKIEIRGLRKQLEAPLPTRKPLTEDQIVRCFRSVWPAGGVIFTTGAIAFAQAIEAAHQISDAKQMVCEWKPEDDVHMPGTWASACGQLWSFIDGTPADNRVSYCHGCGRQVAEVHNPDQDTAP